MRASTGRIQFDGNDLMTASRAEMRPLRGDGRSSLIQQEPMTSLNPVLSIGVQIGEAAAATNACRAAPPAPAPSSCWIWSNPDGPSPRRRLSTQSERRHAPARHDRHGGGLPSQAADRRRADHGARRHHQAQCSTCWGLRRELAMAVLLITHDPRRVAQWADRIAVMYAGRIVERRLDRADLFAGRSSLLARPAGAIPRR